MATTITVTATVTVTVTVVYMAEGLLLDVSDNDRYLVDRSGDPVLLVGDAAWSAIAELTTAEMDTYLEDRAGRGFNCVLVNLIEHLFATNAPNNINDDAPFTGTTFQSAPNEDYFTVADYFVTKARTLGIYVLLAPLYLGYVDTEEGWDTEIAAASTADMEDWGEYVGNRYVNYDNIIWCIGGDRDPGALLTKVNYFATGLRNYDTRHLITFHGGHGDIGAMAITQLDGASWLTINNIYALYQYISNLTDDAYAVSPTMPFFHIEGDYENTGKSSQQLRAQAYWTILDGGMGHIFGNSPVWKFAYDGGDWTEYLDDAGSVGMTHLGGLFNSIDWHLLAPDSSVHDVLISGYGTRGNDDFAPCGYASDGSLAVIYMPSNRTMTVDMTEFSGSVTARWYDPTSGQFENDAASPVANTDSHEFSHAGNNDDDDDDWVLILEA